MECNICKKYNIGSPAELIEHCKLEHGYRIITIANEVVYACDACDRNFKTEREYKNHVVKHNQRKRT